MIYTKLVFSISIFSLLLFLCYSCETAPLIDESVEREKILEQHELQRKYHFEKMAKEFVAQMSTDYISVNRGEISQPSPEESRKRFQNYFDAVSFEKWDDVAPPIIRFSDDYTMAYTTVAKEVIVNYPIEDDKVFRDTTEFAWVAIYKKEAEEWKIDCVASTTKPKAD